MYGAYLPPSTYRGRNLASWPTCGSGRRKPRRLTATRRRSGPETRSTVTRAGDRGQYSASRRRSPPVRPATYRAQPTAVFAFNGNRQPHASRRVSCLPGASTGGPPTGFSATTTASRARLAAGSHVFEVRARDLAGNEDPTPARREFAVGPAPASRSWSRPREPSVAVGSVLVRGVVEGGESDHRGQRQRRGRSRVRLGVGCRDSHPRGHQHPHRKRASRESGSRGHRRHHRGPRRNPSRLVTPRAEPGPRLAPLTVTWRVATRTPAAAREASSWTRRPGRTARPIDVTGRAPSRSTQRLD